MNVRLPIAPLLALLCCGFFSCKKKDGDAVCRLQTARITIGSYDATTTVDYDGQGRMARATTVGTANKVNTFAYSGDTIKVTETTGSSSTLTTVITNSAKKIRDVLVRNASGQLTITIHYDYNSSGKMIRQSTTYGASAPLVYNIAYNSAGDAITETNAATGVTTIYHDYETTQPFQDVDGAAINSLLSYGATAVTNMHVVRTTTSTANASAPVVTTFSYTYGDGGRITGIAEMIGSQPSAYTYTYRCD